MPNYPFICAVISDKHVAEQIEHVQDMISAPVRIVTVNTNRCIVTVRKIIDEGATVIISRGSVWQIIKNAFPLVPALQIPLTCCDAIHILEKAKQFDCNIGVVGFDNHIAKMLLVAPYLGVSLTPYRISEPAEIEQGCREIQKRGLNVLVGGGTAVQQAHKLGLHGVLHTSSSDGILQVLNEAERIFNAINEERSRDARVRAMLNALKDSVISLNEKGEIKEYNIPAEKMLSGRGSPPQGIQNFLNETGITDAVRRQLVWSGENKRYKKKVYICNIIPAYSKEQYCGANVVVQDASHIQSLEHKIRRDLYVRGHVARYSLDDVIGQSREMRGLVEKARLYAESSSSIFIYGESGTGKEVFAQGIHQASSFRNGPFVGINCTALPETLLESELFGYAEGAFTGAKKGGKAGLFEMAHNGTLFLDEIGEIPMSVQAKLLRVLEEKTVMRLGEERYIPVNVRIICATNKDLADLVRMGSFREDLFYRLNVLRLNLPPLREHPEDLAELVNNLLARLAGQKMVPQPLLSEKALAALTRYSFPGNVRELRNIIERLVVLSHGKVLDEADIARILLMNEAPVPHENLPPRSGAPRAPARGGRAGGGAHGSLRDRESDIILQVLEETGGNKSETARRLGISPSTLWRKLKRVGRSAGADAAAARAKAPRGAGQ